MKNKTINLTGSEMAITGLDGCNAAVRNDSADVIYVSAKPNITAGADGVLSVPAGQSAVLFGISEKVYMLGNGSAALISSDYSSNPFKTSTESGGSAVDDTARTAISTHAGNYEIHVTAEEKAEWNGKAELSDIPTTLPANGGNADTVNGRTVQIAFFRGISGLNKAGIEIASTDTADAIWKAVPADSVFATETQFLTDASWNFPAGTTQHSLLIMKLSNNRLLGMYLYPKSGGYVYFANVDGNGSYAGNWRKICDGGDAATLAAHPVSDFVLKSDFDALAARVAALEA